MGYLRSVSITILLSAFAVALSIALLVGWTLVIVRNADLEQQVSSNAWLLVLGSLSFMIIMSVLIWFSVFLVREIREGRRQITFIDSVTHELKSPLSSLKLCLETISRPEISDNQREELRQMMLDDVERLAVFIEDILVSSHVASRLFGERAGHVVDEVHLEDSARRCADLIRKRHHLQADAIVLDVPEELSLYTDGTALETVLKNLLDNAVKYSGDEVSVRVTAQVQGPNLVIDVVDTGIGIPHQHLKRIFDRFYRVPAESVRARRGTGLGLFVVSALLRNIGGRVEASSPGPGQGTRMRVVLPTTNARRDAA